MYLYALLLSITYFQLIHMHSSRFLLHYDRTKWPYHICDGISMDVAKSNRRGYLSLGIVTPAFMIQDIRSRTNLVVLRHRLVVDSLCHWFLYTLPFFTFQAYPHRLRSYAWDRGRKTRYRWSSATFPTQRMRLVLDRTEDSKNVLSLLHSGR